MRVIWVFVMLLWSIGLAMGQSEQDSLRLVIREMPGVILPDGWKEIDPFVIEPMVPGPNRPKQKQLPDYLRFSQGMAGYYFAHQDIGIYGPGWATLDSLRAQEIRFSLPDERGIWTPNVLKTLGLSKTTLIILAIILQVVLL